jgi:acyl carrier protein
MTNHEKLKQLLIDVFLLDPSEYSLILHREEIDTWDSLGTVSMAVGIQETFGYHFTPDEANSIRNIQQIIDLLESKGISFDD